MPFSAIPCARKNYVSPQFSTKYWDLLDFSKKEKLLDMVYMHPGGGVHTAMDLFLFWKSENMTPYYKAVYTTVISRQNLIKHLLSWKYIFNEENPKNIFAWKTSRWIFLHHFPKRICHPSDGTGGIEIFAPGLVPKFWIYLINMSSQRLVNTLIDIDKHMNYLLFVEIDSVARRQIKCLHLSLNWGLG